MNIKFTPDPSGRPLYFIDFDIDEKILEELKQENWKSITPTHLDDLYTKRQYIDGDAKGKLVNEVCQYMWSPEFKKTLLDLVWKDFMFQNKWGPRLNYEKLDDITIAEFQIHKDKPGFSTDFHLENRSQIAFGMIFFMHGDDPDRSTYFYQTENRDSPMQMPSGMGKGWLCVNTHWGWHEGWNKTTEDRYSASINFTFDMFTSGAVTPDDPTIKYIRRESDTI